MTARSTKARLQKLEERARAARRDGPWFLVWERTEEAVAAVRAEVEGTKLVHPSRVVAVVWPYPEEPPAPRWVTVADDLTARALDALILTASDDAPGEANPAVRKLSDNELSAAIMNGLAAQVTGPAPLRAPPPLH
jgi:hypothetical protein